MKETEEFYKNSSKPFGLQSQCKECHNSCRAAYKKTPEYRVIRRNYQRNPESRERNRAWKREYYARRKAEGRPIKNEPNTPLKRIARAKAKSLTRKPCEICGAAKSEAHHGDYSKPLDVTWLCRDHHAAWHRLLIAEN